MARMVGSGVPVVSIPDDAWYRDDAGAAVIDTEVGEELWREWERAKAAARVRDRLKAEILAMIGDGSSLILADGRGLAVLSQTVRQVVDDAMLADAVGLDLDEFKRRRDASRVERPIQTLHVAMEARP
jgi:hypothetical protein